jgi:hypothetical protein
MYQTRSITPNLHNQSQLSSVYIFKTPRPETTTFLKPKTT